jgi:hypothetical protein
VRSVGVPNATWLTFRRTYASWSHDKGVPGKVVAKLMGHTNADVTLNVYTQVLDDRYARQLIASAANFHDCSQTGIRDRANSLKGSARRTGRFPQLAHPRGGVML